MAQEQLGTVPAWLGARLADNPTADLAACGQDWLSVGRIQDRARRLATGLYRLGVRPGDRVASMMSNRDEAVELFFACAALGAVQVPLNVFLKGEFLRYQLDDAQPRVVIADGAAYPLIANLSSTNPDRILVALENTSDAVRFHDLFDAADQRWPDPEPDDLACVLYTSGTTGMPKGCMIDQGYLVHMPKAHMRHGWFTADDTSLCPLPLYHGFALSALMDALVAGCRVAFDPVFDASVLIRRAREIDATQIFGVGAMAASLLATPPKPDDMDHQVDRAIFIPLAPAIQAQIEERFGVRAVCEGYGQTEVLPATMGPGHAHVDRGRASTGRSLPWLDVQVVDDDDQVLSTGKTGEIVVRPLEPHSIFSGYWRTDDATPADWRQQSHHTGDLGYFDDEGRLYFVDRKKDALRRRGENVSSVELELAIARHPAIAQVAVHATPAGVNEDEIKACLVLEPDVQVTPEELFEFFSRDLPYYAVPRYIEFLDQLPTNAMGRVLKHKLREWWDSPTTIDFRDRGLVVARSARR